MEVLSFFAGIWPIVGHYGFWGLAMAACAAAVWFRPTLFKPALWTAAVITAGTVCYGFGVNDGEKRVRAQWTAAEQNAEKRGDAAHSGAVRDVRRAGAKRLRDDRFDRDNH
jgi:hypothetical protein